MREKALNIGSPASLAGVMTEPEQFDADKPVFVILNSGVMHHVGACRLSVKLSRAVARRAGMLALRFDFSGIGDSVNRSHSGNLDHKHVAELREVLDYIEGHRGASRFVLCGLCSGAHHAINTAVVDERVVGLIQYDGSSYPTWRSYLCFYVPRLFKWKHWRSVMRRAMGRIARPSTETNHDGIPVIDARFVEQPLFAAKPPKSEMEGGLQSLVERGVRLLSVFTGNDDLDFMYRGQYADCFSGVDFGDLLTVEHFPTASHIITEPYYQKKLVEITADWARALPQQAGHAAPPA